MKKRFLFFILLIICASLFVGCFDMGEISDYISDDDEKTEETEVSYTVHLWVSEEDGTQTYKTSGEELKNLPTFSRAGYTFKGIYDAKEGGSLYIKADGTATQLIYKDIDLYCQWEAKTYTISYTSDIGRVSEKSVEAKAGQVLIFQTPLYNENQYSFLGWYYGDTQVSTATNWKDGFETLGEKYGELSSTELTLTARFGPAQLKVIFDYNDGSYQTVEYNATYGQMFNFEYPTPTGINTEVIYWSEEQNGTTVYSADYITGTLTLYAIWNDYKEVKFYTDDTNFLEKKYYKGEDIEVENPTREGYDFDGWYTSQNYFGNPIESFSYGMLSKIYYAKWTPVVYNLTYSDGELAGSVITYTVEDEFTLQSMPEKEGYTFTGWKDETGRIHTKKEIGKTIGTLLSAVYTPNTYTITYKDGENTVGTLSTKYNEAYELKAPDKKGYYNELRTVYYMTSKPGKTMNFIKLSAPTFGNVAFTDSQLIWNVPANVNTNVYTPTYQVYLADGTVYNGNKNGTTMDITKLVGGNTYTFTVKAIGDGETYINSEKSTTVTIKKLKTPTVTIANNAYTWKSVSDAVSYAVYVDGVLDDTEIHVAGDTYSYTPKKFTELKTYSVEVYAIGDQGYTTIRSDAFTINQQTAQLTTPEFTFAYDKATYQADGKISATITKTSPNALGYMYTIAGVTNFSEETTYAHCPASVGTYQIRVYAVGGTFDENGIYYLDSQSQGGNSRYEITLLASPNPSEMDLTRDGVLRWTTIKGATGYHIVVTSDGETMVETDTTAPTYEIEDFAFGHTYTVTVYAKGNGTTIISSETAYKEWTVNP